MENADVFLGLQDFLERMRQPSAADFVKSIKSFIVSFSNNVPDPERGSAAVQQFFANMEAAFRAHPLWAGCSEEELESAGELAQKELQKINTYKAPRDKLVCILSCCKVINNLLLNAAKASNEDPPGADEFLPVLIYVTIKANPPQLHSNLLYIQRFRSQSRLVGEAAYFFTNMLSAESFISNIDAKALSMSESDFETNMESARALLSGLATEMDSMLDKSDEIVGQISREELTESKHQALNSKKEKEPIIWAKSSETKYGSKKSMSANDQAPITKVPSLSELENKGANMLLKEDKANKVFQEYPYLFAHVGDLTINDVEDLLNNYKQLVFKYVCLSKGLGGATSSFPSLDLNIQSQHHAETVKESEDHRISELNDKPHINTSSSDDGSNQALVSGEDNVESQLLDNEASVHEDGKNDETSQ
ncbi:vacuolar protein sorting-associated protein 9A-like isoform X2 [Mangifera indica]|uniref:vacuolar protein sorting-associated protein 9A-like isoform X2 n=1 Tax=Mangifera indica TaxID=29780 RepID=UPI001CF989F0|nr:vacuolar protein sorting-associated protein 9A-like isoform X2 [Mangifera indica]